MQSYQEIQKQEHYEKLVRARTLLEKLVSWAVLNNYDSFYIFEPLHKSSHGRMVDRYIWNHNLPVHYDLFSSGYVYRSIKSMPDFKSELTNKNAYLVEDISISLGYHSWFKLKYLKIKAIKITINKEI